jgi:2-keto-3-deoxy-L-rhamnonate aldolase RhmA
VRSINDPDVSLFLDNCVQGIIYPDINTAAEARQAVDVCKFAPLGKRSVTGGYPMFDYAAMPLSQSVPILNEATLVGVMIETVEGLENVEEIAAVPGIDVIHVGTNDLLVNMGMAGQFDAPEIIEAQARVNRACAANGIAAGCGGNRSIERQANAVRNGAQFLTTQTDIAFLSSAARSWTDGLHSALD